MVDLSKRLADLSPEDRARLESLLLKGAVGASPHPLAIPRRGETRPLPLSFAQQRLWFLEQLEPHSAFYNIHAAFRVQGALHRAALQTALDALVARHEALRTTFEAPDGQPAQVVVAPRPVPLAVLDLAAHPEPEREAALQRHLAAEVRRPFDLTRELMLRAMLVRLGEDEHVLLVVLHHIASDGWSMGVFWRELGTLYAAAAEGRPPVLPDLPIQYADYAVWQRQWLQGDVLEAQLAYWRGQLADAPSSLELPTDRPRPAVQTFRGAHRTHTLPPALRDALEVLSRQAGATLFMTLLAAFQTLLARYTGQEDIVVGSPIAGRTRAETEGLIGFFVNTLALRTDLAGNPPFRELLGRVREVCLGAYAHQELPFEKLVEELQPARTLSQSPLFQVMFVLQNAPRTALALPGLSLTPLRVESGTAKFDLTVFVTATDAGLQTTGEYNADLFDAATIDRLLGHFQTLLEGIVAAPERPIGELPLLTAAERHRLLVEWNATETAYPRDCRIHELFEAQVARTPEAVAVVCDDQQLTYGELNRRANQLAHQLQTLGVGPDSLVGICLERSLEMVVGLLGILKAGGAYVPLDPAYPQERLAFMLEDSRAAVLLTQTRLIAGLPAHPAQPVCLDTAALEAYPATNPASGAHADNLAYVIYTSGSTGQPKGVAMPHRALVNLLAWQASESRLSRGVRTLQFAPLSFDVSFQEIFTTWCAGGTLVLVTEDVRRDPPRLLHLLADAQVSRAFLPPTALQMLAEAFLTSSCPTLSLREVIAAGEQLQVTSEVIALFTGLGGSALYNHYGPTETHVVTQFYLLGPPESWPAVPPIGRPIANTQVYVLDRHLQPVPIGVPGELYLGGACLARGYLHRPDLTAERFLPHPFSPELGARLYRTGDRVRYRADGTLEFLGRRDHQVKLRGFRIELGEIEARLMQHPAIGQGVVVAQDAAPGGKRLVAYLVAQTTRQVAPQALRDFLRVSLPDYMIPSVFIWLDRLPITPSGKVDRRALPAPIEEVVPEESEFVTAPQDELETRLVRLWGEALGVRSVGRRDNFFDLGGHSLLAARLFARLEKEFGRKLPLALLFEAPTVEQLAALIRQRGWSPSWRSLVPIQPHGSRSPLFLVPGVGGNVVGYAGLARLLGSDQPSFGLQARGLDGKEAPFTRIEEIAAHHVEELRTVQLHGPYYLVGGCLGGVIAFEMAHQLMAQGEPIGMLAMLDTWPGKAAHHRIRPRSERLGVAYLRLVGQRVVAYGRTLGQLNPGERLAFIAEKVRMLQRMMASRDALGGARDEIYRSVVERANLRAWHQYILRPYPGRILYIRAEGRDVSSRQDTRAVWQDYAAGGLEIYALPVEDSGQMLVEPHVQSLADYLTMYLQRETSPVTLAKPKEGTE